MRFTRRKIGVLAALLLSLLPVYFWIVLSESFWERISALSSLDDRLVEAYAFMFAGAIEVAAIWTLQRCSAKPPRWLRICSYLWAVLSGVAVFVFFCAAVATVMQGW